MGTTTMPLSHIRVLDFTRALAGSLPTVWMAALGAEVIKVESHFQPDATRRLRTDDQGNLVPTGDPRRAHFIAMNHSKLGVTVNLRKPDGVQLIRDLVAVSDVVVESFSRGVMERFGLGLPELRRIRPDIVVLGVSGFGRTGPMRDDIAYGAMASGFSGMDSITGYENGVPQAIGGAMDSTTGLGAYCALMIALYYRGHTGQGQFVDLAMTEVQMSMIPEALMDFSLNGRERGPRGNGDGGMAPHGCYPCRGNDSWLVIAVGIDEEWTALCKVMGLSSLAGDPRFSDPYRRWLARDVLDRHIRNWTRTRERDEAVTILQKAGVPAAPSYNVKDIVSDPHLKEHQAFATIASSDQVSVSVLRVPGLVDGAPQGQYLSAPDLGEHNPFVFGDILGLPPSDVERLTRDKVIY